MKNRITKKTICPLDCPDSCGIIATLESGKIISLQGDTTHPITNGYLCNKMRKYHERIYSDQRILSPQLRCGAKGSGEFTPITWEEAWEILTDKLLDILKNHGPESILPFMYAGNMGVVNRFAGFPLFNKIGTLNLDQTICSAAASAGWKKHCNDMPGSPPEFAAQAKLIIAWGINLKVTNVHFWQYVRTAQKRGAKLVVIDPYRNNTAKSADHYIPVKPGGDVALALGLLKSLLDNDGLNKKFLEAHTENFSHLEEYLTRTSWKNIENDSGISHHDIESLAILVKEHYQTFIRIGVGVTRNSRGGMAIRAISSLGAALGLFDYEPGRGILLFSNSFIGNKNVLTHPSLARSEATTVNMIQCGNLLNSPDHNIKAFIVYNANPLTVAPDASLIRKALEKNDLFTVVHEQVMTPTARYADLLLPATTSFENHDLYTSYGHYYLGIAEPVIQPMGDSMSNFDFFQTLAQKLGYGDHAFLESAQDRINNYLNSLEGLPNSNASDTIRPGEWVRSNRDKKHRARIENKEILYSFAVPGLPEEPAIASLTLADEMNEADLMVRFPFLLLTPPHNDLLNSTFGESFKGKRGSVLLHPLDADELGINDGEQVILENFRGKTIRLATISTDAQKGLLVAEGLFWELPSDESGGINDLTSQRLTDMGGGAVFHESRVSIRPFQL